MSWYTRTFVYQDMLAPPLPSRRSQKIGQAYVLVVHRFRMAKGVNVRLSIGSWSKYCETLRESDIRIATMARHEELVSVIENRVKLVNQLHGARYVTCAENPAKLRIRRGVYSVTYCSVTLAEWDAWDVDGATFACCVVDSLYNAVFEGMRVGIAEYRMPTSAVSAFGAFHGV